MAPRSARFEAPLPPELQDADPPIKHLFHLVMDHRHVDGTWKQEFEGRLRALEKAISHGAAAQLQASNEILRRIGQDDADGSSGLTGKVGSLERVIGRTPDADGKGGTGLRGDIAKLGGDIAPFKRLRDAWVTLRAPLIGLLALVATLLTWVFADPLKRLISGGE